MMRLFSSVLIIFVFSVCSIQSQPEVTTPLGPVSGYLKKTYNGRTLSAFEGIPYAKPPLGPLRFTAPVPIEPWTDILNATVQTRCIQFDPYAPETLIGDENCLYVNVYVPREVPNPNEQLDVIVFVHGGGFTSGSGVDASPDFLLDRELILVTFNYRLGILGFLSTHDDVITGNFGLKDQNLVLKWVQENIASFGGNPDSVTLTGESAGAVSVHLHYFSPMSQGLFHRGVSHSGSALNCWAIETHPLEKAKQLAVVSGCPYESSTEFRDCLRKIPVDLLTSYLTSFDGFRSFVIPPFFPVIENAPDAFLSVSPFELIKQQNITDVPWVAATMQEEALIIVLSNIDKLEEFNERWNELAQIILYYDYTLPEDSWSFTADVLRAFFFDTGEPIGMRKLAKMITERTFLTGGESSARYQAAANLSSPVYYYNFNYRGTFSLTQLFTNNNTVLGTVHGDDNIYIYTPMFYNVNLPPTEEDIKMKELFMDFMEEYAKTGIAKFGGVNWEPVQDGAEFVYLNITSTTDIRLERVDELCIRGFWDLLQLLDVYN